MQTDRYVRPCRDIQTGRQTDRQANTPVANKEGRQAATLKKKKKKMSAYQLTRRKGKENQKFAGD